MKDEACSHKSPQLGNISIARYVAGIGLGIALGVLLMHCLVKYSGGKFSENRAVRLSVWLDAKREIASKTDAPKVLVAGGSGVFYGVRAKTLSEGLGCRVVNMGTHGAFPSGFQFHENDQFLSKGDVLLYIPEYSHYTKSRHELNAVSAPVMLSCAQEYLETLPPQSYLTMLFSLRASDYFGHFFKEQDKIERKRRNFQRLHENIISQHGDYTKNRVVDVGPRELAKQKNLKPLNFGFLARLDFRTSKSTEDFAKLIISEHKRLEAKGVTLLFSWPNTIGPPNRQSKLVSEKLAKFTELLESQGVRVVGDPYSAMSPKAAFFDSPYHLLANEAESRTRRLLPPLQQSLLDAGFPVPGAADGP